MKPGTKFKNGSMELTVICFTRTEGEHHTNLALLLSHDDGLFITVKHLGHGNTGYSWDWGHYFTDLRKALDDYDKRQKELHLTTAFLFLKTA